MDGLIGILGCASQLKLQRSQSHRTTNGDFKLGAQRAKLTFFFFKKRKGTCLTKPRKQNVGSL